jgi:hypothetical protein
MTIHALPSHGDSHVDDGTPTRQCGRCRRHFPGDVATDPAVLTEWWACADCVDALLPAQRRTSNTHTE